jgi:hypothetical protein
VYIRSPAGSGRINALVAICRQAGYGLDHRATTLLENHPDVLQTSGHCNKPWRVPALRLPHVAHHRSRDLILRAVMATNSRRTPDIV